jgi:carbon storage regulator
VKIGGDIEVKVVDIKSDHVRLGFTAPQDVTVHRSEVWEQVNKIPLQHFTSDVPLEY